MINKEIKANRKNLNKLLDYLKEINNEENKRLLESLEKW